MNLSLTLQRNGFFVECGALDGERSSNTIWLEQKRGWTGLLIEMDPSWYLQVRGKNRKSFTINACISPYQYPIKVSHIIPYHYPFKVSHFIPYHYPITLFWIYRWQSKSHIFLYA